MAINNRESSLPGCLSTSGPTILPRLSSRKRARSLALALGLGFLVRIAAHYCLSLDGSLFWYSEPRKPQPDDFQTMRLAQF